MKKTFPLYEEKKAKLSAEIKQHSHDGEPVSLQKDVSNLFRPREKRRNRIDVRHFNQVLCIDKEALVAEVEGMIRYEDLVRETLKYDCLPTVVPQLKTITIGGALSGIGIESSSFRYGLVHETILEAEVLLSDGSVVVCNADNEHRALFFALPNSFGTLGYAIKVKVKLIPTKKFVHLTYAKYDQADVFFEEIGKVCKENHREGKVSFVDGVLFNEKEMVIAKTEFVDEAPYLSDYTYQNIYYKSLQERNEDYLTVSDYIWRWDADWFWCSKVFGMHNPLLRTLCGKWMLSSKVYTKIMNTMNSSPSVRSFLNAFSAPHESIIQDVAIPLEHCAEFLRFFQKEIGIKPVWTCPTKVWNPKHHFDFCPLDPHVLYVDFGFWDSIPSSKEAGHYNRMIEKIVKELGGFKSLYSSSFYTEDEFWSIYDREAYEKLKNTYDPDHRLKGLYEKCSKL